MFKAHDIRAKAEVLTTEVKEKLFRAISAYLKNSLKCTSVVICRDSRLSAPEMAEGLCATMLGCGFDVFLNPLPVSTCQFYYSCMQHPESAGLMVTASHNPGNYIGIKILGPKLEPIAYGIGKDGGIEKIKNNYQENVSLTKGKTGSCTIINYLNDYIDYAMKLSGVLPGALSGMRFLLEFFGGSAGTEIALAFQKAGADIVCRNIIPDGYFRQGDPNPIIESSIAPARLEMANSKYDMGFCFDGDGDRIDLMFSDGSQIIPGLNMSVVAPEVMKIYMGEKTDFFADTKSNPFSIFQMEQVGCNVSLIKNGHSSIKAKLRENPSFFGAVEESAHYYLNLPFDINDNSKGFAQTESSLFFALISARCLKENPAAYENIKHIQNSLFRIREWALHCDGHPEILNEIVQTVSSKMKKLGALIIEKMPDGTHLEATLMRFNLPEKITKQTDLTNWSQVSQRISASEDGVIRWEICSTDKAKAQTLCNEIKSITDNYVKKGLAVY